MRALIRAVKVNIDSGSRTAPNGASMIAFCNLLYFLLKLNPKVKPSIAPASARNAKPTGYHLFSCFAKILSFIVFKRLKAQDLSVRLYICPYIHLTDEQRINSSLIEANVGDNSIILAPDNMLEFKNV